MKLLNYIFPKYVQHVLFIATHQCNSRCVMCNIWQEHEFENELSLNEIKNIFDQPRFSRMNTISFSGGEAMTRADLVDVIEYFIDSKKELNNILIATNGLAPDLILNKLKEILAYIKSKSLSTGVWIQISCDGVDDTADKVRGVPGAFLNINSLIDSLNELKKEYDNINVKIVFLTLPVNVDQLETITDYAKEKKVGCQISHLYISDEYYKNSPNDPNLYLSKEKVGKIINFLKKNKVSDIADYYYNSLVKNMYLGEKRKDDCLFLSPRGVFIEANGDVPICMHSHAYKLGNLKEFPQNNFWSGKKYTEKRKLVIENCCKFCKNSCGFDLMAFPKNFLRNLWLNFKNRNK